MSISPGFEGDFIKLILCYEASIILAILLRDWEELGTVLKGFSK